MLNTKNPHFVEGDAIMIKDLSGHQGKVAKLKLPYKGPYHIISIRAELQMYTCRGWYN